MLLLDSTAAAGDLAQAAFPVEEGGFPGLRAADLQLMILRCGNSRPNRQVSAHSWKPGQQLRLSFLYRHEIHFPLIRSFRHRGLQLFFETGSKAGIQPRHANRLRMQLIRLDTARSPEDMNLAGWRLHGLKGDLVSHRSVRVDANWRLTFRFSGRDVEVVDYLDYH